MKDLRKRLLIYFSKYWPILLILLLVGLFFWKTVILGKIPLPGDFIVGVYYPWLDYKWGYIVGVPVKNPITTDVVSLIYPEQILGIQLMKAGTWPLWNPYILAGTPLFANLQVAPFSPTAVVYAFFDNITGWTLQIILQHILAAIFAYLLLRHWKISKLSAAFAGLAYAFTGFNLIFSQWNGHTLTAAFIPLAILFTDKIIKKGGLINVLSLSVIMTLQLLSGYPQVSMYTILAIAVYWLVNFDFKEFKDYLLRSILLVLSGLFALGLSAIQILPAAELWTASQRGFEPNPYEWSFLPWKKIIVFFAPDYFGNHATGNYWGPQDYTSTTGYSGVVVFVLATIALQLKKQKRLIYFFVILAVLSLVISFPTPISVLLWEKDVLGMKAAGAHRATLLFNFSVSMLAGFGFEFLISQRRIRIYRAILIPFLTIFAFGISTAVLFFYLRNSPLQDELILKQISNYKVALRNLVLPTFFLVGIFMLVLAGTKKLLSKKALGIVVFVLMVAELFRFGWKFTPFTNRNLVYPTTPVIDYLMKQDKPYRVTGDWVIPVNLRTAYNIESLEGYETIHPLRVSQFLAALNSGVTGTSPVGRYGTVNNDTSRLLDLANTKFYLAIKVNSKGEPDQNGDIPQRFNNERFRIVFEDKTTAVLESNSYLPRAFMVYDWDVVSEDNAILDEMLDPNFPQTEKIVLETKPLLKRSYDSKSLSVVNYIEYQEQSSRINVETNKDGLLFVSDSYFPGWKAYIDGRKTDILRADFMFRAVVIPAGVHVVDFKYAPKSFGLGLTITEFFIGAIALLIILMTLGRWKEFKYTKQYLMSKNKNHLSAEKLHENVPDGWYFYSVRENFLQRYWHRRRFEEIGKLIEPVEGGVVLDVGCADGLFTKLILNKTNAKKVVALDVLKSSIDWARKHWKRNKKMKFFVGDAHKLDFRANTFDAVFSLEMLEHVYDPKKVLKEIKRVLKKDGYGIFLVPSDSRLFKLIWFLWGFYRGRVWKHTHIQTYKNDYLVKINEKVGFKVEVSKKFLLGMLHAVRVRKI